MGGMKCQRGQDIMSKRDVYVRRQLSSSSAKGATLRVVGIRCRVIGTYRGQSTVRSFGRYLLIVQGNWEWFVVCHLRATIEETYSNPIFTRLGSKAGTWLMPTKPRFEPGYLHRWMAIMPGRSLLECVADAT